MSSGHHLPKLFHQKEDLIPQAIILIIVLNNNLIIMNE